LGKSASNINRLDTVDLEPAIAGLARESNGGLVIPIPFCTPIATKSQCSLLGTASGRLPVPLLHADGCLSDQKQQMASCEFMARQKYPDVVRWCPNRPRAKQGL